MSGWRGGRCCLRCKQMLRRATLLVNTVTALPDGALTFQRPGRPGSDDGKDGLVDRLPRPRLGFELFTTTRPIHLQSDNLWMIAVFARG